MLDLFILFFLKLMDCSIGTIKTILLIKNKIWASALANAFSTYFYIVMIVQIAKSNSNHGIIAICLATFIGTALPSFIFDRLSKDNVWIYTIVPNTNENGKNVADSLRANNIAVQTYKGYNDEKEQVLCIRAFSENKKESQLLTYLIPEDCKYHVVEVKQYNS